MTDMALPPGVILILAGLILPLVTDRIRKLLILVTPLLTLLAVWSLPVSRPVPPAPSSSASGRSLSPRPEGVSQLRRTNT